MSIHRIAIFAALLVAALCAKPVQAASVTYDFMSLANPGSINAVLVFAAPPSSASGEWETSSNSDVLSFSVTNRFFAPAGPYSASITTEVQSHTGDRLDAGIIVGNMNGVKVTAVASTSPFANVLATNQGRFMYGYWVLAPTSNLTIHSGPPSLPGVPSGPPSAPVSRSDPQSGVPSGAFSAGFVSSSSVPEPSSLLLAGSAALVGLGIWSFGRVRQ